VVHLGNLKWQPLIAYRQNLDYWSECLGRYNSLKDLKDAKNDLPSHCVNQYLLDVQIMMFEGALKKYKDLVDKGYDKKFEVYEKFVEAQIPEQINNFMATDKVDKYFQCQETKYGTCCSSCQYPTCMETCIKGKDCKNGLGTFDITCPKMEFEDKGLDPDVRIPNATFVLKDSDGFYKDLAETWGIEKSWISFGRRRMQYSNGCQYAGDDVKECIDKSPDWWYNYPRPNDKVEIYNPKKIIGDSYPKATEMLDRFKIMRNAGPYDGKLASNLYMRNTLIATWNYRTYTNVRFGRRDVSACILNSRSCRIDGEDRGTGK
jgi:hypothetical protein